MSAEQDAKMVAGLLKMGTSSFYDEHWLSRVAPTIDVDALFRELKRDSPAMVYQDPNNESMTYRGHALKRTKAFYCSRPDPETVSDEEKRLAQQHCMLPVVKYYRYTGSQYGTLKFYRGLNTHGRAARTLACGFSRYHPQHIYTRRGNMQAGPSHTHTPPT